jgi:hypothetical protein
MPLWEKLLFRRKQKNKSRIIEEFSPQTEKKKIQEAHDLMKANRRQPEQ